MHAAMFINVVLPEPDGPMIATYSPRSTRSDTSRSASTRASPTPYVFQTCCIEMIGRGIRRATSATATAEPTATEAAPGAAEPAAAQPATTEPVRQPARPRPRRRRRAGCRHRRDDTVTHLEAREDDGVGVADHPRRDRRRHLLLADQHADGRVGA